MKKEGWIPLDKILAIYKKENNLFFSASSSLVFFGAFLGVVIFNFFWVERFFSRNIMDIRPLFESLPLLLIFLSSAITMKMWSDEKRSGTIELLLTSGASNFSLLLGKFFSCSFILSIAILATLIIPLLLSFIGSLDWFVVFAGYLASILIGISYISFGMLASVIFDRQIASLLFSTTVLVILYAFGLTSIETTLGDLGFYLSKISPLTHFESICKGVIDAGDFIYYVIFTLTFLILTVNLIDRFQYKFAQKKWKQKIIALPNQVYVLLLVNFIVLFMIGSTAGFFRFDLTKEKHYTISEASINYIKSANQPILLRGYFSDTTHPLLAPLVPRLEDLLNEYKIVSEGDVVAEFIDPSDYPDLEREANERYQINPTPFQFADRYKSSVVNSYFNILIEIGEHYEVLSFDDLIQVKAISENNISVHLRNPEYDITKTIRSLIDRHHSAGHIEQFIENPVSLTAFFSKDKDLPIELVEVKKTVTNYLNDRKKDKNRKIIIEVVDPSERTKEFRERLKQDFKYEPFKLISGPPEGVWFHLSVAVGGRVVDIPLSLGMDNKRIAEIIDEGLKKLLRIGKKTIGFFSSADRTSSDSGISSQISQLREQLEESFLIEDLTESTKNIDTSIDLLLLVAPKNLSVNTVFALDQFLMKGGSVVIFSSPLDVSSQGDNISIIPHKSGLEEWLLHHGIEIKNELVSDMKNSSFPIPVDRKIGDYTIRETQLINYPFFINVREDVLESSRDINQGLEQITVTWASPISITNQSKKTRHRVFLNSSKNSWSSDKFDIQPNFNKYPDIGFPTSDQKASINLGIIMDGDFRSYFREPPNQPDINEDSDSVFAENNLILNSTSNSRLILVSSNNLVSDPVINLISSSIGSGYIEPLNLVENLIDWSLEDVDLLKIRGRSQFVKTLPPLTKQVMMKIEFAIYGFTFLFVIFIWGFTKLYLKKSNSRKMLEIKIN